MVNIRQFIEDKKQNFRQLRNDRYKQKAEYEQAKFKRLKEERIKAEGARLTQNQISQEKARISEAKYGEAKNTIRSFGQGLARVLNKRKAAKSKGKQYGKSFTGGGGLQLGMGGSPGGAGLNFGGGGGGPFGSSPKPVEKKKQPAIHITINR